MKNWPFVLKNSVVALILLVPSAFAEEEVAQIKPLDMVSDLNGVDLLSGKYSPNLPQLSIPAAPNLTLHTLQQLDAKLVAQGTQGGNETYSVTFGGKTSDYFKCSANNCVPTDNYGSTITGTINGNSHIYTQGGSGIKVIYDSLAWDISVNDQKQKGLYASKIVYPDGEILTFSYDIETSSASFDAHRPTKVSSNIGYELHIEYQSDVLGTIDWNAISYAKIVKTGSSTVLAEQTYSNGSQTQLTDLNNRAWQYTGFSSALGNDDYAKSFSLTLPGDSSSSLSVSSATANYAGSSHNNFVTQVTRSGQSFNYSYTAKSGTGYDPKKQFSQVAITGPEGYSRQIDLLVKPAPNHRQFIKSDTDSLGNTTQYTYTTGNRLQTVTFPEGNQEVYSYDAYGNLTTKRLVAKSGSGLSDIVVTANYDLTNCSGLTCYRPTYTIDANGHRTDYTFDPTHGGMLTKKEPVADSGKRRLTTYTHTKINGFYRLTKKSVCAVGDCGTLDEQVTEYSYWGKTSLPQTVTQTNGAANLSQTTSYTYYNDGRVKVEDGPLAGTNDATYYRYDASGRRTWDIGPVNQQGYRVTTKSTYRTQDDQVALAQWGSLPNATSSSLTVKRTTDNDYNTRGLLTQTQLITTSTKQVSQTSYDGLNRPTCVALRMNPAQFSALPSSACTLDTTGDYGQDRITYHHYDTQSRLIKTLSGYGTSDAGIDIEIGYTDNGQVSFKKDGNGNTTDYQYDGVDRLDTVTFADNSYEAFTYDPSGNQKTKRKRDGTVLTHTYDAIHLKIRTTISGETAYNYDYDGLGRQTSAIRGSDKVSQTYDGLSRLYTSTTNSRTLTYGYDDAGRRSKLTYPDNVYMTYHYDTSNALTTIKENGSSTLLSYGYDNFGRLTSLSRGNGVTSSLAYTDVGQLERFSHGSLNQTDFLYNPASQLISREVSDTRFQIAMPEVATHSYDVNHLNQYDKVAGQSLDYDNAGNLTDYDGWTYQYDAHNRLTKASKTGTTLDLAYDATGRLYRTTLNGSQTNFLYDGDELVAEYNSSGTVTRRYVHGIAVDDPQVMYIGSGTNDKRYLLANEQGSILALTNNSGALTTTHQYGPYGEPMDSSTERFRYTGQLLLTGTELYYYKARVYHPKLGRFMQTDPIGYDDGMNWYAYVGNDPVNSIDPSGNDAVKVITYLTLYTAKEVKKAEAIGKEVLSSQKGHNDMGDAIRHSTWHYRMMEETKLPSAAVRSIGIAHELKGLIKNGQPMEEFWMDLNNNAEGINASIEGREVDPNNLITSAKKGDENYQTYTGGAKVTGVVRVSGRIESQRLKKLDEKN